MRSLQTTVMQSLMKASKCQVSCGKNFTSKFDVKQRELSEIFTVRNVLTLLLSADEVVGSCKTFICALCVLSVVYCSTSQPFALMNLYAEMTLIIDSRPINRICLQLL